MNNLTKQLANLYEPKWNELKTTVGCPRHQGAGTFYAGCSIGA